MKEATGELSTTMIAVVAIAAILAIFTVVLLPYLRGQINARMHCTDAVCDCGAGKTCSCTYVKEDGVGTGSVTCPNPDYTPGAGGGEDED